MMGPDDADSFDFLCRSMIYPGTVLWLEILELVSSWHLFVI